MGIAVKAQMRTYIEEECRRHTLQKGSRHTQRRASGDTEEAWLSGNLDILGAGIPLPSATAQVERQPLAQSQGVVLQQAG